jgi:hypothetical protein
MAGTITIWIDEETVKGDIGRDWTYSVIARVYNPTLLGAGELRQRVHRLDPGSSQAPPQREKIELPAGECGSSPSVLLILNATEKDWLQDDTATNQMVVVLECPGPGAAPYVREVDVAVQVLESSRLAAFFKGVTAANFAVKLKLEVTCT